MIEEKLKLEEVIKNHSKSVNQFTIDGDVVTFQVIYYTPDLCNVLLNEYNNTNRPIKNKNVKELSLEILNDKWKFNGDSIVFDINGELKQGQHRLNAVVQSNRSIEMVTYTGVDPKSFKTMDSGVKRGLTDVLHIKGCKEVKSLAPSIKNIFNLTVKGGEHSNGSIGNTNVEEYYDMLDKEKITDSIEYYNNTKNIDCGLSRPLIISFHYILSVIDKERGLRFLDGVIKGVGLKENDIMSKLRNKLIKSMDKSKKSSKLTSKEKETLFFFVWKLYSENKNPNRLVTSQSKRMNVLEYLIQYDFPKINQITTLDQLN